jgi:hypothetical protein
MLLHMSWTSPYHGPVGTLRLIHSPHRRGLGIYEDADGVKWDVHMIQGEHVCARRIAEHAGYYSTASPTRSQGTGSLPNPIHTWLPYKVEVVGEDAAE